MDNHLFKNFEATLKEAKSLTQQTLKLTKRDLETLAELERKVREICDV